MVRLQKKGLRGDGLALSRGAYATMHLAGDMWLGEGIQIPKGAH